MTQPWCRFEAVAQSEAPDAAATPELLTLLVEPHGKVNATTGILPVKTLAQVQDGA
jgi:hypothetical protein